MFGALSSATASSSSFSWTGLLVVAVVVAVVYPVQKRLRAHLSQQRRARWAQLEERDGADSGSGLDGIRPGIDPTAAPDDGRD